MIEVFRTSVDNRRAACDIVEMIHSANAGYSANFDLGDCDRILRVQGKNAIQTDEIIRIVKSFGFQASVLEDTLHGPTRTLLLNA